MGKKVISYQQLLKEAISEFDTSKNLDVKGPMLDPILSYEGDGELPTYKDAASILERYYFNEGRDKGVEVNEADYENDKGMKSKESSKHTEGPGGEEQAGTSNAATIPASKMEKEKDIAKEAVEKEESDEDETEDVTEDIENAVIEKLIAELEEQDEKMEDEKEEKAEEEEEKEEMEESAGNPPSDFKELPEMPKEKESKDPEEHTTGAGTEQAGTGDAEGQVPNRKDRADQMVKPKNYTEQDEMKDKDMEDEDEEELDVDKKMNEAGPASGKGHVPPPSMQDNMGGEGDDELEEAFALFKEEIEKDEEMEDEKEEKEEE